MYATHIQWDTDGNDEIREQLPQTIPIPNGMTDEEAISDYLSDQTGFCHKGFQLAETPNVKPFTRKLAKTIVAKVEKAESLTTENDKVHAYCNCCGTEFTANESDIKCPNCGCEYSEENEYIERCGRY